ncbi:OsmC family protein [Streptomyces wuyuanensis]|uniref:Putative redox protein n=1 Tax=Streptomyces wuyuanensis TaxID=1196353 RepID=A0A1G9Z5U7_9ACTN|nr:OsmC family protein [Streptomyces wuyuanensis]SDN16006.1 putative redox protein [Streptomyces wuyuanensis]
MSGRTVSVREGRRLARTIAIGPHGMTADEPEPISADTGPTPGELLLAALGSCTSMAVRAFADRHGWQLHHVDVDVHFEPQGQIVKNIRLVGDLEPAQVERLLTVAGRCPVHRLLTGDVSVTTVPTVVAAARR